VHRSSFFGTPFTLLAATALLALALPLCAQEVLDGVAAVVNGDVITFSQVREVVGGRERALREQLRGEELVAKLKEVRTAALNDLIDRQLVLQEFKKKSFSIPDYYLDERVQQIVRQEFGGDRQAFVRTLEAQGYSLAKFREVEKEKVIVQAMRQQITSKAVIMVPPQKIEAYYRENRERYASPDSVKLRMICIKRGANESGAKRQMADEIRNKIKEGAAFDQMAQMYSEDSSQDSGGDWGWIDRKTLNPKLTDAAFGLKAGQVSEVLEIGDSYYILLVEARKNAEVKPLSELRDDIEKELTALERQKIQDKWIAGLREKAHIKMF
jgi:parvulin-like peptidyl-prolyl isomerase